MPKEQAKWFVLCSVKDGAGSWWIVGETDRRSGYWVPYTSQEAALHAAKEMAKAHVLHQFMVVEGTYLLSHNPSPVLVQEL